MSRASGGSRALSLNSGVSTELKPRFFFFFFFFFFGGEVQNGCRQLLFIEFGYLNFTQVSLGFAFARSQPQSGCEGETTV